MSRDQAIRADILQAVRDLRTKEYNWNNCGGLPLRPDVFATLEWLTPVLCGKDDRMLYRLGAPAVELNTDGTVDFFWEYYGRSLVLTFLCEGTVKYVRLLEDEATSVESVIVKKTIMTLEYEVSRLLVWVVTGLLRELEVRAK